MGGGETRSSSLLTRPIRCLDHFEHRVLLHIAHRLPIHCIEHTAHSLTLHCSHGGRLDAGHDNLTAALYRQQNDHVLARSELMRVFRPRQ
jgi:hypothetical protein